MKSQKITAAAAIIAMMCSSAAFAQLALPTAPTTTTTTTTAAPAPAPAPAAPAVTSVSATAGKGAAHANEKGKADEQIMIQGTISGNTLTVTSIAHGKIKVGMKLSDASLPNGGITITAFGTGNGGVGTYTFK